MALFKIKQMLNPNTKIMSVNINDAVLVFMNRKRIIALYDKSNNDYAKALSLFRPAQQLPDGTILPMKACSASLWVSGGEVQLFYNNIALDPSLLRITALQKADIFLNGDNIVIGVGDMRDGKSARAEISLSAFTEGQFIVNFVNDNSIEIYCINPINLDIPEPMSLQCQ